MMDCFKKEGCLLCLACYKLEMKLEIYNTIVWSVLSYLIIFIDPLLDESLDVELMEKLYSVFGWEKVDWVMCDKERLF